MLRAVETESGPASASARCAKCLATLSARRRCGRCKSEYYCGVACQQAHWATHRPHCFDADSLAFYMGADAGYHCVACAAHTSGSLVCGACRSMRYCREECKLRHQDAHRALCVRLQAAARPAAGRAKRHACAAALQAANAEDGRALPGIAGWPRINATWVHVRNLQQEEQIWRELREYSSAALAHLQAIPALAAVAFTEHSVGDVPAADRRGAMLHMPESAEVVSTQDVGPHMRRSLHLAKLLVRLHDVGTHEETLAAMQALVDRTVAAVRADVAASAPDVYVPASPNNRMC